MLYHLPSVVRRPAVGIKVRLPVAGVQIGVGNRVSAMQHHSIAHINTHMGDTAGVIGAHEEHQITGLGVGYRRGDIVEPLGAQPPGIAQAGIGQHIADEAGTVKGGLRAAPAPQ